MEFYKITVYSKKFDVKNTYYKRVFDEDRNTISKIAFLYLMDCAFDVIDENGEYNKQAYKEALDSFDYKIEKITKEKYNTAPQELTTV